jgi:hypothetical protein
MTLHGTVPPFWGPEIPTESRHKCFEVGRTMGANSYIALFHLTVANSAMMDVYCTSTISHFLGFDLSPPRYLDFPNNNHHLLSFRGFLQHLWHQWWCLTWQNWALNRLQKQSPEKSLCPSCGDGVSPENSTKPWVRESCSLGATAQQK